jgi:peptide/nickel transport system substrate-binding protein
MIAARLAAAALVAGGLLCAAGPASANKENNTLVFAADQVPESLDSYFNNVRIGVILAHHIWDNLIYRDPKTNQYKGELATSWKWVDDKTLDLDLRKGVKFHNGDSFSADDVVTTLNFVSNPENKSVTQANVNWIASAEKLDTYKVRLHLKAPFPAALEYLAGPVPIYPGEYYKKVGPKGMSAHPVGSGPYKVTEYQPGRLVRLERNKDYFKESPLPQPTIDKLELRLIPDLNTQIAELMAGGVDWIYNVPSDQAKQLEAVPTLTVKSGETMRIVFLSLNTLKDTPAPALRDIRVREAIAHAIDRQAMVKTVVGGSSRVLNTNCFPSQFGCTDEGAPRWTYDPAKAKSLLAAAGFPNGFDIDFYAYRNRDQTEAMIGYLRAVGIRARLHFMQYAAMRDAVRHHQAPIAHQTWGSFSVNDVSASIPVFFGFSADDVTRDPEVHDLLKKGGSSVDPEVRKKAYAKALKIIAEKVYSLPLYSLPVNYAFTKDLDFTPYPDEIPRFWEARWK